MASPKLLTALGLVVLVVNLEAGSAYRCYDCGGPLGENVECEVDLGKVKKTECPEEQTCIKFNLKNYAKTIVTRACEPRGMCEVLRKKYEANDYNTLVSCNECQEDLCNSSNSVTSSVIFGMVVPMLLRMIYG